MNADVDRGALWARDLDRLRRLEWSGDEHLLVEVRVCELLARELAAASNVDELEVRQRLARGSRAFGAWSRSRHELASWLWVSTGSEYAPPLRQELRFAEDECYGWAAGTREEERGRGLFSGLLEAVSRKMAEEGSRVMWVGILDENLPSRRAFSRAGWRPILRVSARHRPEPTRVRCRPVEYADERLVERARRLLFGAPVAGGVA